ncbi:MAG: 3-oxo-tetronate kinase, partial [Pseudomonadota bacterium]
QCRQRLGHRLGRRILFKYCSTFDSTPEGNIGPVLEALAEALGTKGVIACPAFPATGRSVYQGHLFVHDKLLNESGLENHPLNPMTDPDIRRWLARQSAKPVGHVASTVVSQGSDAVKQALDNAAADGAVGVIADAVSDDDLLVLGAAAAEAPLITGGSGIALGLPRNFIQTGQARGDGVYLGKAEGPALLLAGSCSRATLGQVDHHATRHPCLRLEVDAIIEGSVTAENIVAFAQSHQDGLPLVYSSSDSAAVRAAQEAFGTAEVAETLEGFFAELARLMVAGGTKRLIVAGGETSGAVVSALSLTGLRIGPQIDPGVPALFTEGEQPLGVALKSGNFGAVDFFEKAATVLAGR